MRIQVTLNLRAHVHLVFRTGHGFRLDAGSIAVLALQFEFCGRAVDLAISIHNQNPFNKLCENCFFGKKGKRILLQKKIEKKKLNNDN